MGDQVGELIDPHDEPRICLGCVLTLTGASINSDVGSRSDIFQSSSRRAKLTDSLHIAGHLAGHVTR